ncbi:MAG: PKD domain-containing protein [Candidatus Thermoplasmatota archaeon]|nr:PKD domain-containing protein [Candidatus Thermoplasmatota archaeon]
MINELVRSRRVHRAVLLTLTVSTMIGMPFYTLIVDYVGGAETEQRMLYDESGDLIGMQVDPAMARKEMSPDMLQSYGEPMEPVQTGQENLKVFSNEDDPIPMLPPFADDVLVYTSGTADDTPRIAFNPTDGWLWTVFTHDNGVDDDIYAFYSDDTGVNWYPALQTTGAYNESNPAIAIAGNTIMIAYEQDNVGDEQNTFFIRSQDGGQNWGEFYINWDWTNPDPPNTNLTDFNDPDISVVRPQWFHWTMSAWGPNDNARTVAFMWTENDGDSWSMVYWTFGWHVGEDFEHPVIMENTADELVHNAYMRENTTVGGYDIEWLIVDHALSSVTGWWTANLDDDNTELGPDIFVRDDYVYLVWQNGTVDPDLTAFYSDDGGISSLWFLYITRQDGFGQMYPSVYIHDDYVPHISCVNDTSITYLNNTNVLTQAWDQWKADDFPGSTVADFRATDILYALNNPRIVFADARFGAADIWYTDLGEAPEISITITRSPLIAVGDILVDGVPCAGTCVYQWVLGSMHTLDAPSLISDPVDPNIRYSFVSWSDGGLQSHVYTTPSTAETVTAYYANRPPVAVAKPPHQEVLVGETAWLYGNESYDPDGYIVNYSWWVQGPSGSIQLYGDIVSFAPTQVGTYVANLTVRDNGSLESSDYAYVQVPSVQPNQPPVADAGDNMVVFMWELVTFNGSGSYDPDGYIVDYLWDFADGSTASGVVADHTYLDSGTYHVTLTVVDDDGLTDTDTVVVIVLDPRPDPPNLLRATLTGIDSEDILIEWELSEDDGGGFKDVINYAIYHSNTQHSEGIGYQFLKELPPGTTSITLSGWGDNDWSNHFFYVQVNDTDGYTSWNGQAGKFVRFLEAGKRIASIPLIQDDETLETVLQSLDGSYDHVRYYKSSDQSGHWKSYWTFKTYRTLFSINHKMGFWIQITKDDYLVVAGLVPELVEIELGHGWNFVGYPSFTDRTVSDALSSIDWRKIDGYSDAPPYHLTHLNPGDIMTAGEGFWIWVDAPQVWIVGN